ncbi:MAG: hypothetical protein CSA20_01930 [Deltaproteobacteria bacterium]|nr:MAG: hypothetical protein CSA20_01930 [Deltaproteobacteria bacterium]
MNSHNSMRRFLPVLGLLPLLLGGCALFDGSEKKVISHDLQDQVSREQAPEKVVPRHLALAKDLINQKHYEVALRQLELAMKNEKGAELYYLEGVCYRETGNLEKAFFSFRKAIDQEKTFAMAYNGLGLTFVRMEQLDKGIEALRQAIHYDPARADFLNNLGYALMKDKQYSEAARYLRRCLTIDPGHVVARNNLAISYGFTGQEQEALSVLLEGNPPEVAYRNMSAIYQMTGDPQKAAAARQMAARKYREKQQEEKNREEQEDEVRHPLPLN